MLSQYLATDRRPYRVLTVLLVTKYGFGRHIGVVDMPDRAMFLKVSVYF